MRQNAGLGAKLLFRVRARFGSRELHPANLNLELWLNQTCRSGLPSQAPRGDSRFLKLSGPLERQAYEAILYHPTDLPSECQSGRSEGFGLRGVGPDLHVDFAAEDVEDVVFDAE